SESNNHGLHWYRIVPIQQSKHLRSRKETKYSPENGRWQTVGTFRNVECIAEDDIYIVLLKGVYLLLQLLWNPNVIGIEKSNQSAKCHSQSSVARARELRVALPMIIDSRIFFCELLRDR